MEEGRNSSKQLAGNQTLCLVRADEDTRIRGECSKSLPGLAVSPIEHTSHRETVVVRLGIRISTRLSSLGGGTLDTLLMSDAEAERRCVDRMMIQLHDAPFFQLQLLVM